MITITDTDIELALKKLLQQNVVFCLKNKNWRTGKIILFKQSGFFIEMIILNKKDKHEKFEIPIPFNIKVTDEVVTFDYQLTTLARNNKQLIEKLKSIDNNTKNKFYNTFLEIKSIV